MHQAEPRAYGDHGLPFPAGSDMLHLTSAVRAYRLPPELLPLAKDRVPFASLSDGTIENIIRRAILSTTRKGRYTDAVRRVAGIRIAAPQKYTVIEAHIDLTGLTPALSEQLISLGFEPDNFAEIQPEQYTHHFTIQHQLDRLSPEKATVYAEVHEAANRAAGFIDSCRCVTGYVETECYTTHRIVKLAPTKLDASQLGKYPFRASTFISLKVARNDQQYGEPGYDTVEKRAADIHVKLAPAATVALGEPRLEELFRTAGFYRIRSDAGNYMFSAHFSTLPDANSAYDGIVAFARTAGGITGVMREICTSMWRKTEDQAGEAMRAEVPPHLRLQEPIIA